MIETLIIISFFVTAYLLYSFIVTRKSKKKNSLSKFIKDNYNKAALPIEGIKILTRDYFENEEVGGLVGTNHYKEMHKYISVITYDNFPYRGKKYSFKSNPIELSNSEIMSMIKKKGSITVYFDGADLATYYFDLSFLN